MYFALRWKKAKVAVIDHCRILKKLNDNIEIYDLGTSNKLDVFRDITQFDAWAIVTHYCNSRSDADESMKNINTYNRTLVDVTHGIGALFVGLMIYTLLWLVIGYCCFWQENIIYFKYAVILISLSVLSVLMYCAFRRSLLALQALSNSAFATSIMNKWERDGPVRIYYDRHNIV